VQEGINALSGEVPQADNRSVGMGLYQTVYYAGMALVPLSTGHLQRATGSAAAAIWFSAVFTAAAMLPLGTFRWLRRTHQLNDR